MAGKVNPQSEGGFPRSIGNPAANALANVGITRLEQLTEHSEREILAMHGIGPKAVKILRETLAEKGLSFKA